MAYRSVATAQGSLKALFREPGTTRCGSEYTSQRNRQALAGEGLAPSVGSIGVAFENAGAETVMGCSIIRP